jgi:phospholipid/cholesterol/gamma-HCH transport system substrate-binding protein
MKKGFFNKAVIVGIFIFLGIAIFVTGVFTIGMQKKTFSKAVELHVLFDDVGGLQEGNNVWLSGVKIGTVKKISFHENTQVEIVMRIDEDMMSHIFKDARVKISSDGFIGNRIVSIKGGTAMAGRISNGEWLVTEKSVSTDDMLSTLQENNKNVLDITENLKVISRRIRDGKGTIGELLNDASIAGNLRATMHHFRQASINSEVAISKINEYVNALNNKGTLVNELTTDTLVYARFKSTLGHLNNASLSISEFADSLKQAGKSLSKTDNPAGVMLHDEKVAADLKEMIRNLNTSSQELDEDLKALQSNFLFRGYFKQQEKQRKKDAEKKQDSLKK